MQEAQLDKYRQQLTTPSATAYVAQVMINSNSTRNDYGFGVNQLFHGKARGTQG